MSKPINPTEHHYRYGAPFRYCAMHLGPNRAQRRHDAPRDPRTKKLLTPEAENAPHITPPPPTNEESTDA